MTMKPFCIIYLSATWSLHLIICNVVGEFMVKSNEIVSINGHG